MDKAAYEATAKTVGKWIVPLAKAQHIERELVKATEKATNLAIALREVMAFGGELDAGWELDPAAMELFERCRALVNQFPANAGSVAFGRERQSAEAENSTPT